ncbi:conserved hypothetical protein [Rhodopseudomonas palustris HaA2]|uniref:Periplasmic protein-like protein n=1 Tax=Rhodopseudomonas palustris (strain HaA2) TaxID=316058 RepID=Q2IY22_RHOP2|nr:hypothetical protein [Rhodopseudomonas palustris]ABD06888.1 conserved hypothetical protein [Rhodopseudomonas palustris HaA2]
MNAAVLSRFARSTLTRVAALGFVLLGAAAGPTPSAQAGGSLEQRKLPMRFDWVACEPNCTGWISAVGIVTADTPKEFDEFARSRPLDGAALVLDSSGGSVNDAITLGRRWRKMGLMTTVGASVRTQTPSGVRAGIAPQAYCESMCVFLLLAGKTRYVPEGARVRVHQIWMGDRAEDARAASYTAQDLTIIERDIGRLAKYTFEMGGTGDLLALALSVPPWEDLHQLSPQELRDANLVTAQALAELLPPKREGSATPVAATPVAAASPATGPKPVQDRFVQVPTTPTKTAEAALPTGGTAPAAPPPQ